MRSRKERCAIRALAAVALFFAQASDAAVEDRSFKSGALGVSTSSFLNSSSDKRDSVYPSLMARYAADTEGPLFRATAQGEFRLTLPPTNYSYFFEFSEANVGTSSELAPVRISLGRKLEHWNRLDERWQLGIWQPRFRWDYLTPEQVGLTGAYLAAESQYARLVVFGSGLYVPERGVPITVQDGTFVSQSPWFISPPSRISIMSRDTPVEYSLMLPEMKEIILHPSTSATLQLGKERGPWASVGYAYKPMNQLLLAYDGKLTIHADKADIARVTVIPRIVYHQLASADVGYAGESFNAWFSLLGERPGSDETPSKWTTQEVSDSIASALGADWTFSGSEIHLTKIDFSYLRQWGGNAPDKAAAGAGAGSGLSVFEGRYPFQNALSFGVQSTPPSVWGGWTRKFLAATRATVDLGHQGSIWSTEFKFRPKEAWMFGMGFDLLGSNAPEGTVPNDFIGRYRANDRVHGGVSYVF